MSVPVSPLFSVTDRPVAKTNPKGNSETLSQDVSHSGYQSDKSKHYHARVVGGNAERAVDKLNPTSARDNARSYPGLANG